MDEQGIYCPQCRAYVHFWVLVGGRRPPELGPAQPGAALEMPEGCKLCGYKGTYRRSDLRTRRVPTEPLMAAVPAPEARPAAAIDGQNVLGADKKASERT